MWAGGVGEEAAVAKRSEAGAAAGAMVGSRGGCRASDDARSRGHAWLITGPPGSGRSVAARAFAAALQCTGEAVGCGECAGCRTTMGRTNADVVFAATETSIINVETARSLVLQAQSSPSQGLWRVIVVEDALIHISEPTRPLFISYAVFPLKKKIYPTPSIFLITLLSISPIA